jgi:DNA-binding CsgD family transcriptional regulator
MPPALAMAHTTSAEILLKAGSIDAAEERIRDARQVATVEALVFSLANSEVLSSRAERVKGNVGPAEKAAHSALAAAVDLQALSTAVDALEALAGLAADAQGFEGAGRLLGAAASLRDSTGYRLCLSPRDDDLARTRLKLGDKHFEAVYAEGRALSLADAVAYAGRGRGRGERKRPAAGWDSLTQTEAQIVELVRQGRTNAEIGRQMFVSARTVQSHLTHIYTKLGVKSRTELASRTADRQA